MVKSFLISSIIFFAVLIFSASQVSGQLSSIPASEGKMSTIINLQTETLKRLFAQSQKIGALGKEKEDIAREIEELNRQIAGLQSAITAEELAFAHKRKALKMLLRSYQRMGPGSYLEIILQSDDLADFLQRLNILRDITRNSGKLIEQLQISKEKQAAGKTKLEGELKSLIGKQAQYDEVMAKEKQTKKELEDYLVSLSAEREKYQNYLTDLQNNWSEFKPLFSNAVKEFSGLIEAGNLPPDLFKLSGSFLSIKGSVTDKALNETIAGRPGFPQMIFSFEPGNVEMRMPDRNLVLNGTFLIHGGNALKLQVREGSFDGISLETGALKELFQDGDLLISFESLLGSYTLNNVEIMNGNLQFSVSPGRGQQ